MTTAKAIAKDLSSNFENDKEDTLVQDYRELNEKVDIVLEKITNRKKSKKKLSKIK